MDPTTDEGGDSKNDGANDDDQRQQQQQHQQQPPTQMMMDVVAPAGEDIDNGNAAAIMIGGEGMAAGGGMMGGGMRVGMMHPSLAAGMSMAMAGHPGGFFLSPSGLGSGGTMNPGMMGELLSSPPGWVATTNGGGNDGGGVAMGGSANQKKGKNGKRSGGGDGNRGQRLQGQQQLGGGCVAKRKKRSGSAASTEQEQPDEPQIVLVTEDWQRDVLDRHPRCKSAEGVRETSFFHVTPKGRATVASASMGGGGGRYGSRMRMRGGGGVGGAAAIGGAGNINCLRKLLAELNRMEYEDSEQLPGGAAPIWLRYDDETPQYMRAIITGPPRDTPYSNGLFAFDVYVPDSYPSTPPRVQLVTTGGGTVRFSPNLYEDGKVCLSLLNTWSGPKWDPVKSSILQILVSIQGLILGVDHPYYMEPGYGGWEGNHSNKAGIKAVAAMLNMGKDDPAKDISGASGIGSGTATATTSSAGSAAGGNGAPQNGSGSSHNYIPLNVRRYEDNIRMGTMKYAIAEYCRELNKAKSSGATNSRPSYMSAFEDIVRAHFWHRKECILADGKKWINNACSNSQKRLMQLALKGLESALGQLEAPPSGTMEATASAPAAGEAPSAAADGALDQSDASAATKRPADETGGKDAPSLSSSLQTAAKHREMEAAAAKGDYISAGRVQAELEVSAKVRDMIIARRKEMDAAAERKDYVNAGKHQLIVIHLERNRRRLQDLERRMFESAARQDFVKAGRFQEQYRILLDSADVDGGTTPPAATTPSTSSAKGPFSGGGVGLGDAIASALMGGGGGAPPPASFAGSYVMPIPGAKPPGYMDDGAFDDYYGDHPDDYQDGDY